MDQDCICESRFEIKISFHLIFTFPASHFVWYDSWELFHSVQCMLAANDPFTEMHIIHQFRVQVLIQFSFSYKWITFIHEPTESRQLCLFQIVLFCFKYFYHWGFVTANYFKTWNIMWTVNKLFLFSQLLMKVWWCSCWNIRTYCFIDT